MSCRTKNPIAECVYGLLQDDFSYEKAIDVTCKYWPNKLRNDIENQYQEWAIHNGIEF